MGDSSTLSFRCDSEIIDALDAAAQQMAASRSKVAREALIQGLEAMEDAPEYLKQHARQKRIEVEHARERRKGWFRSNFSEGMKNAMKKNLHPVEYRQSVAPFIEEAKELGEMPQEIQSDTGCTTYYEWVEQQLEYYRVAHRHQLFEHDAIEGPLDQHEGMQNAREWVERAERIAEMQDDGRQDAATEVARYALEDGCVPADVKDRARDSDQPREDVVVEAALDLDADASAKITSGDDTAELDS